MKKIDIIIPDGVKKFFDEIHGKKHIESIELAKFFGVEKEYREYLLKKQLKESYENIINEENYRVSK